MLSIEASKTVQYWPFAPASSNKKFYGRKRPFELAIKNDYIQANPEGLVRWVIFDVDRPGGALAWEDANLPVPTWVSVNPENGHAHICYGLSAPVRTIGNGVKQHPIRYLKAVRAAFSQKLGADGAYAGILTKNPYSSKWRTQWMGAMYTLGDLEEYLVGQLSDYKPPPACPGKQISAGRNVSIFDATRRWAYLEYFRQRHASLASAKHWEDHVHDAASKVNRSLDAPLREQEVRHISRSIARWTQRHLLVAKDGFVQKQRERAQKSSMARRKKADKKAEIAIKLRDEGKRPPEIALVMQASLSSVYRWLKQSTSKHVVAASPTEVNIENREIVAKNSHEPISDNSGGALATGNILVPLSRPSAVIGSLCSLATGILRYRVVSPLLHRLHWLPPNSGAP